MSLYQIKHNYDVGDRGVFIEFLGDFTNEEVKDIAVYLQFKAEEILDETITLDNSTIAEFFELLGAKKIEHIPKSFCEIDMHYDRSDRCGGVWHSENFLKYDNAYGKKATEFLNLKAQGKVLEGNVI